MASGAWTGAPEDPLTVTNAHLNRPAAPPWPGGVSDVMPRGGPRPPGGRRRLLIAGLVAALVAVAGGVTAGVVSADGKHSTAHGGLKAQTQATASASFSPAASASAVQLQRQGRDKRNGPGTSTASPTTTATASPGAKASPTPHATRPGSGLNPARLTGTWTGTYFCPQGWTGLRLVLKAGSGGSLTATFNFYATQSNVSVPSGSFALTGSYSAKGFQLTPDHWITMPAGYSMVGLTAGPPGKNGTALSGSVVGAGCTTFSVSR